MIHAILDSGTTKASLLGNFVAILFTIVALICVLIMKENLKRKNFESLKEEDSDTNIMNIY